MIVQDTKASVRRTRQITLRVTQEEKEIIRKHCEKLGHRTMGGWVHQLVREALAADAETKE